MKVQVGVLQRRGSVLEVQETILEQQVRGEHDEHSRQDDAAGVAKVVDKSKGTESGSAAAGASVPKQASADQKECKEVAQGWALKGGSRAGGAAGVPVPPASKGLLRHNAVGSNNVAHMRSLTNEEIIQQQGETFILMYNEIAQLRKEIRHIRSNDRPSMISGTRNFSPWAYRDPFRKLEPGQEITVFPDGSDRCD